MKLDQNIRATSSQWMIEHIAKSQIIGIENIPIYQPIPDIIQKEFYFSQYKIPQNSIYKYVVIDSKTPHLPDIIILANDEIISSLYKISAQKDLLRRMKHDGYKRTIVFSSNLSYYLPFGDKRDYYLTGPLVTSPLTISIYKKE